MKVTYIELLGQDHPLCFSLAASEKILEQFDSLEDLSEAVTGKNLAKKVHAVDTVLQILMQAGRIYVRALGETLPPELPCRPSDVIDIREPKAAQAIFEAMTAGVKRTVEIEKKNGKATSDQ